MHFGFLYLSDLTGPQGPLHHVLFHPTKAQRLLYCFVSLKYFSEEKLNNKDKGQKNEGCAETFFFFAVTKKRHFYQLLVNIFYGDTFYAFSLQTIVEAVVNIFILSFCVLKLSCKGSCYINV